MVCCFANGAVYVSRRSSMKRDVIDSGKSAVMRVAGEGRRLCGHEVDVAASPVWPWIRRFEFTAWASNWRFRALHLTGFGFVGVPPGLLGAWTVDAGRVPGRSRWSRWDGAWPGPFDQLPVAYRVVADGQLQHAQTSAQNHLGDHYLHCTGPARPGPIRNPPRSTFPVAGFLPLFWQETSR